MHLEFLVLKPFFVGFAAHKPEGDNFTILTGQNDIPRHLQGEPCVWTTANRHKDATDRVGKSTVPENSHIAVGHHHDFLEDVIWEFHFGMFLWVAQHYQVHIFMAAKFRENALFYPTCGF